MLQIGHRAVCYDAEGPRGATENDQGDSNTAELINSGFVDCGWFRECFLAGCPARLAARPEATAIAVCARPTSAIIA